MFFSLFPPPFQMRKSCAKKKERCCREMRSQNSSHSLSLPPSFFFSPFPSLFPSGFHLWQERDEAENRGEGRSMWSVGQFGEWFLFPVQCDGHRLEAGHLRYLNTTFALYRSPPSLPSFPPSPLILIPSKSNSRLTSKSDSKEKRGKEATGLFSYFSRIRMES